MHLCPYILYSDYVDNMCVCERERVSERERERERERDSVVYFVIIIVSSFMTPYPLS